MGYGARKGLVEENKATLELIFQCITSGQDCRLQYRPEDVSNQQWTLRRVLKATELFPSEAGGRYFKLNELVRTRIEVEDHTKAYIVVYPRNRSATAALNGASSAVAIALSKALDNFGGQTQIVKLSSATQFSEDELIQLADQKGFSINPDHKIEDKGEIWYVANRKIKENPGANIMRELGFTRDRR